MINPWKFVKSLIVQTENSDSPAGIEIFPAGTSNTRTTITSSQTSDITVTLPSTTSTLATTASLGTVATDLSNHIADTTGAHAASAISSTPAGNLAATDVQTALDELQSDIDTRALSSDLNNHVTDGVDAHDASAISNIPSGNLAATDIQAAVNELQSDIDTRALASDLANHISDTTGAHAASAISNIPTGNLAATDIQTAVDELQSDIDTRALASDLTAHINDTADAHDASAISVVPAGNLAATEVQAALSELQTDIDGRAEQRNLISGGRADLGIILIPYADAAGTSPVDGNGGSPNVTAAINTTTPLDGADDFLLTKDAANRQGEGWAIPFTVDPANRAKVLRIKFDYIINSGTFVAGSPSVNSDITVWVYDVTNSRLIQPSGIKLFSNSTSISDIFEAEFQTSSTGEDYRLLLHVGSTSASAYSLQVDNLRVAPNEYAFGTPVTDWQSYTPTGSWNTNVTYSGRWRRVGDSMQVQAVVSCTGAPNAATLSFSIPAGYTVDTAKLAYNSTEKIVGILNALNNATASYFGWVKFAGGSSVVCLVSANAATHPTANALNATTPFTFGASDTVNVEFQVPISGWSSAVQMSNSADTRVVAVRRTINASQSMASGVPTKITVLGGGSYDTHSGWDAANHRYIVPVSGLYRFSGSVLSALTLTTAGNNRQLYLYRNGTAVSASLIRDDSTAVNSKTVSHTDIVSCVAGDILEMYISIEGNAPTIIADSTRGFLSVERVTGPSAIAATETIAEIRENRAGTLFNTAVNVTIPYATSIRSTHGGWNGTLHQWVAPAAGLYSLKMLYQHISTAAVETAVQVSINVNGSAVAIKASREGSVATTGGAYGDRFSHCITTDAYLNAGDTVSFINNIPNASAGNTASLSNANGTNRISIVRIGL